MAREQFTSFPTQNPLPLRALVYFTTVSFPSLPFAPSISTSQRFIAHHLKLSESFVQYNEPT
jgi:hypothetical protein